MVTSKKDGGPEAIKFITPSEAAVKLLPQLMPGVWFEDFSPTLASLDLCISEIDK
jgi:NADH:ubiquinone oxidoreductase subunit D